MKNIVTILLLVFCTFSYGQKDNLVIKNISDGTDFNFPLISTENKLVENKVNITLQLSELDLLKGFEKENILEVVTQDLGGIYGSKTSINFEILNNNKRVLSILFDESSCGLTCAYWNRYYNFNPQNGDRYFLNDFFSDQNFEVFSKIIDEKRENSIRQQIENLKKSDNDKYLTCLEEYLYSAIKEDDLKDFFFDRDSLYFDSWNLLSKNDKFYDLNTVTGVSIKEIESLLNDYGEAVLITGEGIVNYHARTVPQLFEGTIGKNSHIYLLFRQLGENNYEGIYAYKKYGKAIYLGEGRLQNGIYSFKEEDKDFNVKGKVSFKIENTSLSGFWSNLKNKKLPLFGKRL